MPADTSRQPVAAVDSAWLRMDEPANLMVVTGVLVFEAPIPFSRIRHIFETRLLQFSRFRQRIVDTRLPVGTPTWEEDPHFDLDRHLSQVELAPPADEAALQAFVASLMCRPFEHDRPLWHFYFVPRCGEGRRSSGASTTPLATAWRSSTSSCRCPITRRRAPPPVASGADRQRRRGRPVGGGGEPRARARGPDAVAAGRGAAGSRAVARQPDAAARDHGADGRGHRSAHQAARHAARPRDPLQGPPDQA